MRHSIFWPAMCIRSTRRLTDDDVSGTLWFPNAAHLDCDWSFGRFWRWGEPAWRRVGCPHRLSRDSF